MQALGIHAPGRFAVRCAIRVLKAAPMMSAVAVARPIYPSSYALAVATATVSKMTAKSAQHDPIQLLNKYDVHGGKQALVNTLAGTLNSGTLYPPPNASDLIEELQNYEVRTSEARSYSYAVFKTGAHEDEATALALSLWSCQNWGMSSDRIMW